jgi:two-component system, chemotaxis family, response regulator Rcp1
MEHYTIKPNAHVLLVEDNLGDIFLAREAFKEARISVDLQVVQDGEEAIAYLRKTGKYTNALTPDLVLLDLNLPKKDGCEVLADVKTDPSLRIIPIVMFTTSSSPEDINRAYANYANCYITKPLDFSEYTAVVKAMESFWLSTVRLPEAVAE